MASVEGERYLVSMLGTEVAWVRNVKAAAGRHIPVDKDAPVENFEAIAEQIPVFRVLPAG